MKEMIPVSVDSVRINLMGPQRIIILREQYGQRVLTIWVGPFEAENITVALRGIETARPLTHTLLKNVFRHFNATLRQVEITELRDDVFYGFIVAEHEGKELRIDTRPSDGIALALRAHIPILVSREVFAKAGFVPEIALDEESVSDAPQETSAKNTSISIEHPKTQAENADESKRLSVFEDFLEQLDLDDQDQPPGAKEDD